MPGPSRVARWCTLLGVLLLSFGCGTDSGAEVAAGRYRLYVEGSVTDTLRGPALLRRQGNEHVGIELGPQDGPGMSIELTSRGGDDNGPAQVRTGRYNVMAAGLRTSSREPSLTGALAVLSVAGIQFVGTRGHLSVTRVEEDAVAATLRLEMDGRASGSPGERSVHVTGVLRARAP